MTNRITRLLAVGLAGFAASCTVSDTKAPPLSGPSEMSLSLAISASPDVLTMDGTQRSVVDIVVRDENGQPKSGVRLRAEIVADGATVDYGTLSPRQRDTDGSGRASFSYTAPLLVGTEIPELKIGVTPIEGGDAASHLARFVAIRLVGPGSVLPGGLSAAFTVTPEAGLVAGIDALFDGSQSVPPLGGSIRSYRWDFGDGSTASGMTVVHRFSAGTFIVTLTTTDNNGLTASTSKSIQVQAGTPPNAVFVSSPTAPAVGQSIFFNAGQSVPGSGRRIVSYRWNFGDGTTGSGVTRTKVYNAAGTYVVVLTVTDDIGQVGTASTSVAVCALVGC